MHVSRTFTRVLLLFIAGLFLSAFSTVAMGAEDVPEPVITIPDDPTVAIKPNWVNFIWRSGLAAEGGHLYLHYRDVPSGSENTFESDGGGMADLHMASAWFYPTSGRQFMLTLGIGGGSVKGEFANDVRENGFLDGKQYWRSYAILPIGAGYRWLLGDRDQVAMSLYADMGWHGNSLFLEGAHEGLYLNGGTFGLVYAVHHRDPNGFLAGGSFEIRSFTSGQIDTRILGELVDVQYDSSMVVFSVILGYEPPVK